MSDEAIIKLIISGVGIFLALAIFSAMSGYYAQAKYNAGVVAVDTDPDGRYDKAMQDNFNKEELFGYEVKNLINYYYKEPLVRVDIHNANYINEGQTVVFRAFFNANKSEAGNWSDTYEGAVNLLFPFQKFRLHKFSVDNYTAYVLNGKYDKNQEDTFNIEHIEADQIKFMMNYYYENTYIIVEVLNVQEKRTREVLIPPVPPATEPTIGTEEYIHIQNFSNANNSSATAAAGVYDEAMANIKSHQSFTLTKTQTDRFIRYTITGANI